MKKLIAVALVLVLALSLVACSSETNNTQGNKKWNQRNICS